MLLPKVTDERIEEITKEVLDDIGARDWTVSSIHGFSVGELPLPGGPAVMGTDYQWDVTLSSKANDKKMFGVLRDIQSDEEGLKDAIRTSVREALKI
jgi:hypothetical protein